MVSGLKLGLSYAEMDEMTIGEILDIRNADLNLKAAAREREKELEEIERLGRWAKTKADFELLANL